MKIDDIIRKCIEIPGVSIKRSEFNVELLMKTKEGKGSMTFFQLFPGLTIAYIFINSPTWAAPNLGEDSFIKKGPLLLNYCVTGRCEIILNNGNFVYVKDGDISSQSVLPKSNMSILAVSMREWSFLLILIHWQQRVHGYKRVWHRHP